jgi:putative membrane protein
MKEARRRGSPGWKCGRREAEYEIIMGYSDPSSSSPAGASSRVRDHLANERTFLAWIRTVLGLIGLGFVLARMGLFLRQLAISSGTEARRGLRTGQEFLIVGVVFLVLGTVLGGWTGWLYEQGRRAIDEDRYRPARRRVLAVSAVVVVGGLIIVGLVLWQTLVPL